MSPLHVHEPWTRRFLVFKWTIIVQAEKPKSNMAIDIDMLRIFQILNPRNVCDRITRITIREGIRVNLEFWTN